MNERICDLVLKAQTQAAKETIENSFSYEGKVFERFAELIVSDAIAKIESVGFKSSNDIPFEITDLFVSQIKQHFGVK